MGEVYRAHDTKLDRDVAIKVLPEEFAQDEDRLARFEREARLLASLNHPNIASIYGYESNALVLELVEGQTLAERLQQGPIPVEEAIVIAKQIAEALEAGHEAGVIHRDLKPANIKLKEDGTIKVLDYGLAKALEGEAASAADSELSQSPTLTRQGTQVGVILGTAAYMSPEQAKGKRVDNRTDVWAFGAVLYEMLTGKRAFPGDDVSETLASVIKSEPDLDALPAETPETVRRTLQLCLNKDLKERVQAVGDVRLAMQGAFETNPTTGPSVSGSRPSMAMAASAAVLLSVLTGFVVWNLARPDATPSPVARFSLHLPGGAALSSRSYGQPMALSPDGSRLVYTGNDALYLRAVDRTEPTRVRGTEGARSPFFSPDGEWIGFWANSELQKVSIRGGAPESLAEIVNLMGAQWGADGTIVFSDAGAGILRVSADGGTPEVLVPRAESALVAQGPQILPGGTTVLFTLGSFGNWHEAQIVAQSLETKERKVLIDGGRDARYLTTGHLAYVLDGTLLAVPFDVDELAVMGSAVALVEGVKTGGTASGAAQFSVSDTGTLVYQPGSEESRTLVWVDREGREEAIAAEPRGYTNPRISPDGSRVALDLRERETDIWIWNFARETLTRLTFDPDSDMYPVWTPDGSRLAFTSNRGRAGVARLHWKSADGTGSVERLAETDATQFPTSATPDGKRLLFDYSSSDSGTRNRQQLGILSFGGSPELLLSTEFSDRNAEVSPDGRLVAYESNALGRYDIYVRPFPNVEAGRWLVSKDGGSRPLWSPDGRELFYLSPSASLMAVDVETEPVFAAGNARGAVRRVLRGIRRTNLRHLARRQALPHDQSGRERRASGAHPSAELVRGIEAPRADGQRIMPLTAGTKLGPYEVVEPIGKGGMGEVYRARDAKLDRDVAIKVLPEEFARDEERLARFEREAKLLASLNHPNIASIYGYESNALVLELVEGPTLAERIAQGASISAVGPHPHGGRSGDSAPARRLRALPVDEVIAIAKQIAEALEAGHEAGVIHRDLKPANIKLKEDGTIKVLDYGLAKALQADDVRESDSELSQSPTLTRQGTQIGVILGTAAYMSPEQAKGKRVDKRADIWAFGAVVYEMLTGTRAFAGEDVSETLAFVLTKEPDWELLPAETPNDLKSLLRLCLRKDARRRVRDIGDVRLALEGDFETKTASEPSSASVRWSPPILAGLTAALVGAVGLAVWSGARTPQSLHTSRFSIPFPEAHERTSLTRRSVAISPDGTQVVYVANERLYLRPIDELVAQPIEGTGSGMSLPFFSPDGRWLGFYVARVGELKKIALSGGRQSPSAASPESRGVRWFSDDSIVFSGISAGIFQVAAAGGTPELLVASDRAKSVYPQNPEILPGGQTLVYAERHGGTNQNRIMMQSFGSDAPAVEIARGSAARYVTSGHLVVASESGFVAVPFDLDSLEVTGPPVALAENVSLSSTWGDFDISRDGTLVYFPPDANSAGTADASRTLAWVDRQGREASILVEPRAYFRARVSRTAPGQF